MRRLPYIIALILIFIMTTIWGFSSFIENGIWRMITRIWRIITSPIESFLSFKRHLKIAQFIALNRGKKILFYNFSNYKLVEKHLLPLLDDSFFVYFINKEGIEASTKDETVRAFIKHYELKGGYPVLVKVGRRSFVTLSLKKVVTGLKNGEISSVYVQSQIKFFFENNDEGFEA